MGHKFKEGSFVATMVFLLGLVALAIWVILYGRILP